MTDEYRDGFINETWRRNGENAKEKKIRPDNYYVKTISQEEAEFCLREAGPSGSKYNTLKQELELAWSDYKEDHNSEIELRNEEERIAGDMELVTTLESKRKAGVIPLTENEKKALAILTPEQLKAAHEGVRDEPVSYTHLTLPTKA